MPPPCATARPRRLRPPARPPTTPATPRRRKRPDPPPRPERPDQTAEQLPPTRPRPQGSSARMPADVGSGTSNGRANRCSCAIASFSCSVYAGRPTTYRQSRTAAGIAPASVAVAIHRNPERSSGTSR